MRTSTSVLFFALPLLLSPLACSSSSSPATPRSDAGSQSTSSKPSSSSSTPTSTSSGSSSSRNSNSFPTIGDAGPGSIVAQSSYPMALAVDGTNVYWTDGTENALLAVPKAGGAVTTLATGFDNPSLVAVDGSGVYVVDGQNTLVESVPLAGGKPTTLATDASGSITAIALDSGTVFWTDALNNMIESVPTAGGSVATLFTETGSPMFHLAGIAVDSTSVYFTDSSTNTVSSIPKAGGKATVLTTAATPSGIAVDSVNVYFTDLNPFLTGTSSAEGTVFAIPKAGGVTPTVLATTDSSPAIVVTGANLLFVDAVHDSIWTVPTAGGTTTELGSDPGGPNPTPAALSSLATDGTSVYWLADSASIADAGEAGFVGVILKAAVP